MRPTAERDSNRTHGSFVLEVLDMQPRLGIAAQLAACGALLAWALAGTALAQDDKNINVVGTGTGGAAADRWALLVGINDYERDDISDLKYAVADVEALYNVLTDTGIGGFAKRNVKLMTTNSEGDLLPKRSNMMYWLGWLKDNVTEAGLVVIYFSGHGISDEGTAESYLLPVDADLRNTTTLQESSVPVAKVQSILKDLPCKKLILFLDACRNDPKAGKGDVDNPLSDDLARGLELEGEGRGTFYSCKVGERSYEWGDKKQGVFSYYLCDGLRGNAADRYGNVSLDTLRSYVTTNVVQWGRDNGREMTPWLHFEGTGTFTITRGEATRAKLTVQTDPPYADLALVMGGEEMPMGLAPREISPGDERSITLKASKPGCGSKTETINVEPGEERTVTIKLLVFDAAQAEQHTKNIGVTPVEPTDPETPTPPARTYAFVLNNPAEGDNPGRSVVLMGSGPPGAEVQYTVNWVGQGFDPKITGDNIASDRVRIADDGSFFSNSVGLYPAMDSGVRRISGYTVKLEVFSEAVDGPATITRRIAGNWMNPQQQEVVGPVAPPPAEQWALPWRFEGVVMDYSQVPGAERPKKPDRTGEIIGGLLGGIFGRRPPKSDTEKLVRAGITAALATSTKPGEVDLWVREERGRQVKVTVDDGFVCGSDVGPLKVRDIKPGDVVRVDIAERMGDWECTAQQIYLLKRPGGLYVPSSSTQHKPGIAPPPPPPGPGPPPPRPERPEPPSSGRNWRAVQFRADAVNVQYKNMGGNYFGVRDRGKIYRVFCDNKTRIVHGSNRKSFATLADGTLVDIKGTHLSENTVRASLISIK